MNWLEVKQLKIIDIYLINNIMQNEELSSEDKVKLI